VVRTEDETAATKVMMRSKGETVGEVGGGVLSVTTDEGGAGDGERGYGRRVWWWW